MSGGADDSMVSGPVTDGRDMRRWEKLGEGRYLDEHYWIHLRKVDVLGDDARGYLVKVWEEVTPSPEMPTSLGTPIFLPPGAMVDGIVFLTMTKEQIRGMLL